MATLADRWRILLCRSVECETETVDPGFRSSCLVAERDSALRDYEWHSWSFLVLCVNELPSVVCQALPGRCQDVPFLVVALESPDLDAGGYAQLHDIVLQFANGVEYAGPAISQHRLC